MQLYFRTISVYIKLQRRETMSDNLPPNFVPYENSNLNNLDKLINDPNVQNYLSQQTQKSILKNLYKQPNIPLKTDEERQKFLTDRLDKQYFETKQLNNKMSSNNLYVKELKADLKEEFSLNKSSENTLSGKDKKILFWSVFTSLLLLMLEYHKDVFNFISSLISKK